MSASVARLQAAVAVPRGVCFPRILSLLTDLERVVDAARGAVVRVLRQLQRLHGGQLLAVAGAMQCTPPRMGNRRSAPRHMMSKTTTPFTRNVRGVPEVHVVPVDEAVHNQTQGARRRRAVSERQANAQGACQTQDAPTDARLPRPRTHSLMVAGAVPSPAWPPITLMLLSLTTRVKGT